MRANVHRPDPAPDDGQQDVTDGTVENYPLDWENDRTACPIPGTADP